MTLMLEIFNRMKIKPRSYRKTYTMRQYYMEFDSYQRAARDSCPRNAPDDYEAKEDRFG